MGSQRASVGSQRELCVGTGFSGPLCSALSEVVYRRLEAVGFPAARCHLSQCDITPNQCDSPHTQAYPSDWAARGDIDYLRSPEDEELSQFRLQWFAAMESTFWQQTGFGRLPIPNRSHCSMVGKKKTTTPNSAPKCMQEMKMFLPPQTVERRRTQETERWAQCSKKTDTENWVILIYSCQLSLKRCRRPSDMPSAE